MGGMWNYPVYIILVTEELPQDEEDKEKGEGGRRRRDDRKEKEAVGCIARQIQPTPSPGRCGKEGWGGGEGCGLWLKVPQEVNLQRLSSFFL